MSTLHQRARAFRKGAPRATDGTRQPDDKIEAPTSAVMALPRVFEGTLVGGNTDE